MNSFIIKNENGKYDINSGFPEFGYELIATLPYAYHLHQKGMLNSTTSGNDTSCFYFFSDNHIELDEKRSWDNCKKLIDEKFPNISIHKNRLNWDIFSPPPIKKYYQDKAIIYEKPTVVIFNRKNNEWRGEPVNYLDADTLIELFGLLEEKYQIVYIDSSHFGVAYEDHAEFQDSVINLDTLKKYNIISLFDLTKQYPELTINEIQCRLYAGCDKFVSSNGGLGILASYFGGENIIFSKMCYELDPDINSFNQWYPKLSKSTISVVRNESELLKTVSEKWIEEKPLFNILIRTSGRPNYFHDCIRSVLDQNYKNYNIIVGVDDPSSLEYVQGHKCTIVELKKREIDKSIKKPEGDDYGIHFPFNEYFNELLSYANTGYVIYLDDDDCLIDNDALLKLSNIISEEKSDLIFWRVKFPTRIVPSDENWKKKVPVCRDMSTIGYCHSVETKPVWEPWKRGDYRVAKYLFDNSNNTFWYDDELTGLQRVKQDGYGNRDDKASVDINVNPPLVVIVTAYNAELYLERCIKSILNSSKEILSDVKVLVGVDGCKKTKLKAKELTRTFQDKVEFYYSGKNVGTYVLKNSLLKKVRRRDSIVFFFDSDDVLTPDFLGYYHSYASNLLKKNSFKGILKVNGLDVNEKYIVEAFNKSDINLSNLDRLLEKKKYDEVIAVILRRVLMNKNEKFGSEFLVSLIRSTTIDERYIKDNNSFKPNVRHPHGSFICSFKTLESLGFFNEFRVGQDTDFQNRSKILFKNVYADKKAPYFIRSINDTSLTNNSSSGLGTEFRKKIVRENKKRIDNNKIQATKISTKITKIL